MAKFNKKHFCIFLSRIFNDSTQYSIVTFLFDPQNYILYTKSSDVGIKYSLVLADLNCFCSKMLRDIDGVKFLNWYASKDTNRLLKSKNREQGRDQYKKKEQ